MIQQRCVRKFTSKLIARGLRSVHKQYILNLKGFRETTLDHMIRKILDKRRRENKMVAKNTQRCRAGDPNDRKNWARQIKTYERVTYNWNTNCAPSAFNKMKIV